MHIGSRKSQAFFARAPEIKRPRSMFDRSFNVKDTFNVDDVIPIYIDEIVPGDTINLNLNCLIRLQTQKVPIMDNMRANFAFFYCPSRILWDNFVKMMGERTNPSDSINYTVPQINLSDAGTQVGTLPDKLGLPTSVAATLPQTNALPFRMYNKIRNYWFRDQNLQNSSVVDMDNGPDSITDYGIFKVNKAHDYFTSAFPAPQKGTALRIPATNTGLITRVNNAPNGVGLFREGGNTAAATGVNLVTAGGGLDTASMADGTARLTIDPNGSLELTGIQQLMGTINELRVAFQLQELLETDNTGGTRYPELVDAHFGVIVPDFRLQEPEYLGGGKININTSAVPNTADDLADLGAFATATTASTRVGFTHSFPEHGYVMGLVWVNADITYQQGLNKLWTRLSRYDFFWPELQELGEQSILNKEIYYQGTSDDDLTFGYQERYAEYKYKPSEIHGEFRSTYTTPLDMWHLAEEFDALPLLNDEFIQSNTPIERAITVTSQDQLKGDYFFNITHTRPMTSRPKPASLGRF